LIWTFWILLGIVFYAYIGYTLLLLIFALFRKLFTITMPIHKQQDYFEPSVTLIIPAYNEEQFVMQKIQNTFELDYPSEKLKIIWITDGSTDNTVKLLKGYPDFLILHEEERKGKVHAMNRAMEMTVTPITVFTDANTMLNRGAIRSIVQPFSNFKTGCVTGEKRIAGFEKQEAAGAGEGLYWKYESFIKRLESETGSVVGAVGEIFAVRTQLYEAIEEDTLLDDFTISLQMIQKGFRTKYAPEAWGVETASLSIAEEIKRKIRIATGGMQSLVRMISLLNPFRCGMIAFKYFSHKVLRWTVVPFSFPLVFLSNLFILFTSENNVLYAVFFTVQCIFYGLVGLGHIFENKKIRAGFLFAPYYIFIMNVAILRGVWQFITGNYSVNWQKVKRT
jgi:cellulose synthase/poly-beta-1,6-N-acetylglucosamine synthase-like glycosyltransferase